MSKINSAEELALQESSAIYQYYADDSNWEDSEQLTEGDVTDMRGYHE